MAGRNNIHMCALDIVRATLLLIFVFFVGCSAKPAPGNSSPVQAREIVAGIITASSNSYIDSSGGEPFEQFGIVGMFPRYYEGSKYLLDSFIENRVPRFEPALDTCSPPSPVLKARRKRRWFDKSTITLLDVGNISVDYSETQRLMPTRTFPDLFKVIDGVIYLTDDTKNFHFVPGETYTIHTSGSEEVASFEVVLDAPNDLGEIRLNGVYPGDQVPVINPRQDMLLSWEGEGYGDEIFVEINWTGLGLSWFISCRLKDDGEFIIPWDKTAGMHDPLSSNEHEFTISRVRQTAFRSTGLTRGEFSFVISSKFLVGFETTQ